MAKQPRDGRRLQGHSQECREEREPSREEGWGRQGTIPWGPGLRWAWGSGWAGRSVGSREQTCGRAPRVRPRRPRKTSRDALGPRPSVSGLACAVPSARWRGRCPTPRVSAPARLDCFPSRPCRTLSGPAAPSRVPAPVPGARSRVVLAATRVCARAGMPPARRGWPCPRIPRWPLERLIP